MIRYIFMFLLVVWIIGDCETLPQIPSVQDRLASPPAPAPGIRRIVSKPKINHRTLLSSKKDKSMVLFYMGIMNEIMIMIQKHTYNSDTDVQNSQE